MPSPTMASLATTVQNALGFALESLTYQPSIGASYTSKLVAGLPTGATTISLNTLAAGLTAVAPGDTLKISPYSATETVTNTVAASGGVLSGITITPATTGTTSTGTTVTVSKTITFTVKAAVLGLDQSAMPNTLVTATTVKVSVDTRTMVYNGSAVRPGVGDKITLSNGRVVTVTAVSTDVAGAFHSLLAV